MLTVWPRVAALAILVLTFGSMAWPASAQTVEEVEAFCQKASGPDELGVCLTRRLQVAEGELKRVYRQALGNIDAEPERSTVHKRDWRRAMQEGQRHWQAWVMQDCRAVVGWERTGGAGTVAASTACELERVAARIDDLRRRYRIK